MKYIWQEKDIKCGIYVCRNLGKFDPDACSTRMYKIGFVGKRSKGTVLIAMSDGMVGNKKTPNEMAAHLTRNDMIPMPHKWLIKTLDYMRDWYVET